MRSSRQRDANQMNLKLQAELQMNCIQLFRETHNMQSLLPDEQAELKSMFREYKEIKNKLASLYDNSQDDENNNEPSFGSFTKSTMALLRGFQPTSVAVKKPQSDVSQTTDPTQSDGDASPFT